MQKTIFFILLTFPLLFGASDPKDKPMESLLDLVGVNKFTSSIKKIKAYNSIEEIGELDYEMKRYMKHVYLWRQFDEVQFESGLKNKLRNNFSMEELQQLEALFMKPFPAKVIKAIVLGRDIFSFNQDFRNSKYKQGIPVESRKLLIQNLFILHGMEIQEDKMKEVMASYAGTKIDYITLRNKITLEKYFTNPIELDKRRKKTKEFMINYLAKDLVAFRHYELREYLRVMKGKTAQKFLQLYANYHFLYLTKFIEAYKIPQELLIQLGLEDSKVDAEQN